MLLQYEISHEYQTSADLRKGLNFVVDAEQDPENCSFILPWAREIHATALSSKDIAHFIVESADDRSPVGFVILAGLESPHGSIELRRIVITKKGKGCGAQTFTLVKRMAFSQLGAHRLWLDVKEHNNRARRAYASAGFVEEGLLRECLKSGGEFESLVVMAILRHEYL